MGDTAPSLSVENLHSALNALRTLRSSVTNFFRTLSEGPKEDENDEAKGEVAVGENSIKLLSDIKNQLRDLETQVAGLNTPPNPMSLGNTGLLSLDPSPDKLPLYYQLLDCYA